MLIKCPQCNHDNQLGAIFCRNCGAKLDVESIRPKVIDHRSGDWDLFGIIRRVISLGVLLCLIGVLALMFMPSPDYVQTLTEDQIEAARTKFDELNRRLEGGFGNDTYIFTAAEMTYLYNDKFLAAPTAESGGTYNIDRLSFHLDFQGYTHLRLSTKLGGKIPTTFELKGFIPDPSEESTGASLTVTKTMMGKLSMPSMANKKVVEKFMPALDGSAIQRILGSTARIEVQGVDVQDPHYVLTLKQ
jgi:hypothetical protein